jgi:hypothetical protein
MITAFIETLRKRWENYNQRPFMRLVRLFIARIFHGGGDADTEGLDLSIGLVLSLLALPGGFVSVLLFNKYGSLLQWMRGAVDTDPFTTALPDEYFFIVLSMVVTGAVAVWRWDSIFPDRRDYMNLVPLPISTQTIFFANLLALLSLAGLLALDVNAASSILFPLVVGATQDTLIFFVKFAWVHALTVVLASIFTFFAVFSILGLFMAVLPYSTFKKISAYIRALVVICLVTLLSTSFALSAFLQRLPGSPRYWTRVLPSCWFLGLCQSLRGRADPDLAALGHLAFPALGAVIVAAVCVYAVGYRRYFVRIAEMTTTTEPAAAVGRSNKSWLAALLDRRVLHTPFQRGGFRFICKTLFRSEPHRLVLAAVGGVGLVLACQALLNAFAASRAVPGSDATPGPISADALSVPFIVAFCIIVGLRIVFEIPVELRSNWIFRLMLDPERHECEPLARKVMLLSVLPGIVLIIFPIYAYLAGWAVSALHTLLVATWSVLLTNAALVRFRKLPFTCAFPLFQQHSIVSLLGCILAFLLFAEATSQFESLALPDPIRMIGFIPVAALAWYVPRRMRQNTMEIEKELIFEEVPTRAVEVLQLSE